MTAISSHILDKITEIVGKERITTRPEDLHCYSYDGTARPYLPEVVVFPESTGEISHIMKLANHYSFPVVPRGAGSGMTGGVVPLHGGLVMALSRMNRIIEIDEKNQIAIVEPGVITGDLQQKVRQKGLFYPPDPASLKYCTIGGNAAECAGGPSAVKYGVTKDWIIGLEIVLPSGDIISAGARTEKSVTGYDLTRLFIGSEGTLGIITRVVLRLLPLPAHKETFLITSKSLKRTTELVTELLNANISPCTLEYMDRTAIKIVSEFLDSPPPEDTEALLIVEIDGEKAIVSERTARLLSHIEGLEEFSVTHARNKSDIDKIWQARRSISPSAFKLKPNKMGEDVAVPRSRIPELVTFCEKLSTELDLTILTFGHAGDGNIHVNIMLDRSDPEEVARANQAKSQLFKQAIALEGTLSGEHGIGFSKAPFMPLELNPATISIMKQIKALFDPKNILNPGKIFPE